MDFILMYNLYLITVGLLKINAHVNHERRLYLEISNSLISLSLQTTLSILFYSFLCHNSTYNFYMKLIVLFYIIVMVEAFIIALINLNVQFLKLLFVIQTILMFFQEAFPGMQYLFKYNFFFILFSLITVLSIFDRDVFQISYSFHFLILFIITCYFF